MIHALAHGVTFGKLAQIDENEATNCEQRVVTTHTSAAMIRHTHSTHSGIVKAVIGWVVTAAPSV